MHPRWRRLLRLGAASSMRPAARARSHLEARFPRVLHLPRAGAAAVEEAEREVAASGKLCMSASSLTATRRLSSPTSAPGLRPTSLGCRPGEPLASFLSVRECFARVLNTEVVRQSLAFCGWIHEMRVSFSKDCAGLFMDL